MLLTVILDNIDMFFLKTQTPMFGLAVSPQFGSIIYTLLLLNKDPDGINKIRTHVGLKDSVTLLL